MSNLSKSSLLFGALILLVFGIVFLKQRLGPQSAPPAFIPSAPLETSGSNSAQRPTVLSADSRGDSAMPMNPRWGEVEPLSTDDFGAGFTFPAVPVNAVTPDSPPATLPESGAPTHQDSAATLPPIAEWSAASSLATSAPTSVVTRANDSWWAISERAYGRGDFYKALFLQNRDLIEQPDRIPAGIELQVAEITP